MTQNLLINKAYMLILLNLRFVETEEALKDTGLSLEYLDSIEFIDLPTAAHILQNVNEHTRTPNWPAILGRHLGAASHGPVGYATLSAPSVGKALSTFAEWFVVRCQIYAYSLSEHDDYFEISIIDTTGNTAIAEVFFEAFMRAFEVLIELLTGRPPTSEETQLSFVSQAETRRELMLEEYHSKLSFGAASNCLRIAKDLWYRSSPLYDPESFEFNLGKCRQLLEKQSLGDRLDLHIRHSLKRHFENNVLGNESPTPPPTQEELCRDLYMTKRTLIRKLSNYGTSYKEILERERQEVAEQLLKDARYTIAHISDLLGYGEPANFCRAFKRWKNCSPTEYRRRPT